MKKVSLFIPCTVDTLLPDIGIDTSHLLTALGVTPVYHEAQTCCGQPSLNAGYLELARRTARHMIALFENDEAVVSPSGSCVHTIKHRYPELFESDPPWRARAESLSPRVFELSQYIVDVLGINDVGASFNGSVTYHESCHVLRGLGVSDQPKALLSHVEGATLVPLPNADRCCGFGGEFAVKYPDISEELVKDKAANFVKSGADLLILCEPGCLLNISGYLAKNHPEKRAMHLASFLRRHLKERRP